MNVVPIDATDLADWAVRLYDESPVSDVYAATAQEPPEVHEQRRSLLRESVHRAVAADRKAG